MKSTKRRTYNLYTTFSHLTVIFTVGFLIVSIYNVLFFLYTSERIIQQEKAVLARYRQFASTYQGAVFNMQTFPKALRRVFQYDSNTSCGSNCSSTNPLSSFVDSERGKSAVEQVKQTNFKYSNQSQVSMIKWKYTLPGDNAFVLDEMPIDSMVKIGKEYTAWDRERSKSQNLVSTDGNSHRTLKETNFTKIKQIWIWGERCSCTTAITDLLLRNFDLQCEWISAQNASTPNNATGTVSTAKTQTGKPAKRQAAKKPAPKKCVIGGLPWKHDFMRRADMEHKDDTLHILVTRHPYEWLESMRRNAFYAVFHKDLPMERFLSMQWLSVHVNPDHHSRLETYIRRFPPVRLADNISGQVLSTHADRTDDACRGLPPCTSDRLAGASKHTPSQCCHNGSAYRCTAWERATAFFKGQCLSAPQNHFKFCADNLMLCPLHPPATNKTARGPVAIERKLHSLTQDHPPGTDQAPSVRVPEHLPAHGKRNSTPGGGGEGRARLVSQVRGAAAVQAALQAANRTAMAMLFHVLRGVTEMANDRDPDSGERFPSAAAMREAKLRDWLRVSARMPFTHHISCRDFMLDPTEVLRRVHSRFQLRKAKTINGTEWTLQSCVWRFGICVSTMKGLTDSAQVNKRKKYLDGSYMKAFSDKTLPMANAWLDPELEAQFGYRLRGSVKEAALPYTKLNRCSEHGACVGDATSDVKAVASDHLTAIVA